MGHWSSQFTGHMNDLHRPQQNQPCIFYHLQTGVPIHRNGCNIIYPHTPELRESSMNFGVSQINIIHPQHPPLNVDLNIPPPSRHYSQYLEPPSCIGDFPIQVSHGSLDAHGISSFPVSSYSRNVAYIDDIRGAFKRKIAEENYQYHNASAGPSSSVPPMNLSETVSYGGMRNQPCVFGPESFLVHNTNQMMLGNYSAPSMQIPTNHWLDMNYHLNNDVSWRPVPLPYSHVGEYGARVDPGNVAFFQLPIDNPSSRVFLHPPPPHLAHPNPHQPPLSMLPPRGTTELASSNFQFSRPQGNTVDSSSRRHTLPQMRYLPEEETAILESMDEHGDMRLDIDHMSYEELLALEEEMGIVGTGLQEEFIRFNLKTRSFTFTSSIPRIDQHIDFCVICQSNYEEKGEIATLKCEHEYHSECLKKWLLIKNTCPICKSTAFTGAT